MDIEISIKKIVAEYAGADLAAITADTKLEGDHNLDSLDKIEIIMAVEDEFGIEIPDTHLETFSTVQQLSEYVVRRQAGAIA